MGVECSGGGGSRLVGGFLPDWVFWGWGFTPLVGLACWVLGRGKWRSGDGGYSYSTLLYSTLLYRAYE